MRISDWSSDVCSSDLGPTIKRGYLDAIVRRVNGLDADLIALTGDIVDGHIDRLRRHVAPLSERRSRHGSYYVTGNHEYYHGVDACLPAGRRLGVPGFPNANEVPEPAADAGQTGRAPVGEK